MMCCPAKSCGSVHYKMPLIDSKIFSFTQDTLWDEEKLNKMSWPTY